MSQGQEMLKALGMMSDVECADFCRGFMEVMAASIDVADVMDRDALSQTDAFIAVWRRLQREIVALRAENDQLRAELESRPTVPSAEREQEDGGKHEH